MKRSTLHSTVLEHKDEAAVLGLFLATRQNRELYKRLEWRDTRDGKLANPDVQYLAVQKAAAYVCTERICSAPIFSAPGVAAKVRRVLGLGSNSTATTVSKRARLQIFCSQPETFAGNASLNGRNVRGVRRVHLGPGSSPTKMPFIPKRLRAI